uniref:Craniofacial development protein 2-like n=1 Tax=Nicotiana tabacum TaxID=4097 RepID=A0A1S3X0R6_TOBAC
DFGSGFWEQAGDLRTSRAEHPLLEIARDFGSERIRSTLLGVRREYIRGGDFNGHIGTNVGGYDEVHGGFGFGASNGGGAALLDFAKAFELIDYLLPRRGDKGLCKDYKVIPSESFVSQHRLLVMDVGIIIKMMKRVIRSRPGIRWEALSKDKVHELERKFMDMGA